MALQGRGLMAVQVGVLVPALTSFKRVVSVRLRRESLCVQFTEGKNRMSANVGRVI